MTDGRGKGIAIEASKAALEYVHINFIWHSVETYMYDDDIAARSLIKLGGNVVARKVFPDGLSRD